MIGEKIKHLLELKNISREKLAADLNISDRTMQKIVCNERDVTLTEVDRLASYFGISPSDLAYGEPKIIFENRDQSSATNAGSLNIFEGKLAIEQANDHIATLKNQLEMMTHELAKSQEKFQHLYESFMKHSTK